MSVLRLVFREMAHRLTDFLLALFAVVVAVSLFVGTQTLSHAMRREVGHLMLEMGFNILVLPPGTDVASFWSDDRVDGRFDEQQVEQAVAGRELAAVGHLDARLRERVLWRDIPVLLTGVLPLKSLAVEDRIRGMSDLALRSEPGRARLGYAVHSRLGLKEGDTVEINGRELTVAKCLPRVGGKKDIGIFTHLHDAQAILDRPGEVNMLQVLERPGGRDATEHARAEVAELFPEARVEVVEMKATVRRRMLRSLDRWSAVIVPAVLVACAVWLGHLVLVNVRDRRREIGILRAIGVNGAGVAGLFLGRAAILGLLGGLVGFVVGTGLTLWLGPGLFPLTAGSLRPVFALLGYSLVGAPLLCALAAYVPTRLAVAEDPADILSEG